MGLSFEIKSAGNKSIIIVMHSVPMLSKRMAGTENEIGTNDIKYVSGLSGII